MSAKPTQRELAKTLGVSQTAISLTINDPESKAVTPEKREHILKHLREIDYPLPDWSQTRVISLLACSGFSSRRQYLDEVLKGAREEASRHHHRVVVSSTDTPPDPAELPKNMRGIIWFADPQEEVTCLNAVCPVVMLNWISGRCECDAIMSNSFEAMRIAATHLRGLGHTRIAYFGWEPEHWNRFHVIHARERLEGIRRVLNATGESPYIVHVVGKVDEHPWMNPELVPQVLASWLSLPKPPTAIVTFNDGIASRFVGAAAARGLRVPEDLSIVGVDNNQHYVFGTPPLTTIDHAWRYMARQAVQRLLVRIGQAKPDPTLTIRVTPKLIVRGSTAKCRSKRS